MSWQITAERLLRHVAPDDVAGLPIYLVDADVVRSHDERLCGPSHCIGWTSPACDLLLHSYLTSVGQWQGRGFACVVHSNEITSMPNILGVVLHELAHGLDAGLPTSTEVTDEDKPYTKPEMLQLREYFRDEQSRKLLPPWHDHSERFVRSCCHLAWRAGQVFESVRPNHLSFASNYHPLPYNELAFMRSLEHELKARSTEPIKAIIESDAPRVFVDRWAAATGR